MSKMIQIRHVPDAVHRRLKARAATSGLTLSDYLRREIEAIAAYPTDEELLARFAALESDRSGESSVDLVRAGREELEAMALLPLRRHAHTRLLARVWELRATVTAYDASYVALAELLGAPLLTRDARLANAPGLRAEVEVV